MGERVVGHLEGLICETGLIHQLPCPCEIRREQEESDAQLRRGRGRGWWSSPSQELRGEQALSILRKVLGSRRLEREGIDCTTVTKAGSSVRRCRPRRQHDLHSKLRTEILSAICQHKVSSFCRQHSIRIRVSRRVHRRSRTSADSRTEAKVRPVRRSRQPRHRPHPPSLPTSTLPQLAIW